MGVYNGVRYLDAAIASILAQSFKNFEFIILDDGSTDATPRKLQQWAAKDSRIVILRNEANLGLTKSLNRGIRHATGEWIARQDADDCSLPDRFARQIAFLADNPEVGLLGTGRWIIDEAGKRAVEPHIQPENHTEICWKVITRNPFCHTSTIFKRKLALECPYDENHSFGQDFELWGRLLKLTRGANLPEPLVENRIHDERVSIRHIEHQQGVGYLIWEKRLAELVPNQSWPPERINSIRNLVRYPHPIEVETADNWLHLLDIFQSFANGPEFDRDHLFGIRKELLERLAISLISFPGIAPGGRIFSGVLRYDGWNFIKSLLKIILRRIADRIF
jgi:glycosyltransferase involved in cell wall biosynthesis